MGWYLISNRWMIRIKFNAMFVFGNNLKLWKLELFLKKESSISIWCFGCKVHPLINARIHICAIISNLSYNSATISFLQLFGTVNGGIETALDEYWKFAIIQPLDTHLLCYLIGFHQYPRHWDHINQGTSILSPSPHTHTAGNLIWWINSSHQLTVCVYARKPITGYL